MSEISSCSRSKHRFRKKFQLLLAIVHPLHGSMNHECTKCLENSGSEPGAVSIADCLCVAGYTKENDDLCVSCVSGKYKLELGNNACVLCARRKYKTDPGPGLCENTCPQNSYSEVGANSISKCLCKAGYTNLIGNICSVCIAGKYKTAVSDEKCTECSTKFAI